MASEWTQLELNLPLVKDADATFQPRMRITAPAKEPIAMSTTELLTALLGRPTAEAYKRLTAEHPGLREIAGLYPAELTALGFTQGAVTKLCATGRPTIPHNPFHRPYHWSTEGFPR